MADKDTSDKLPTVTSRPLGAVSIQTPGDHGYFEDPPIEVVIDAKQLKERIIDYLGAVLARCWVERDLLDRIEANPHRALRGMGILLPHEIDIKVERVSKERPRLVIYEYNEGRTFRRRVCYLQLIMMAGR